MNRKIADSVRNVSKPYYLRALLMVSKSFKASKFFSGKSNGSLIPLSFGFFIISLSLLFVSININAAYATKKDLINLGESAIQRSAHEIDQLAYYLELNRFFGTKKIPLNCVAARIKFFELISNSQISGHNIKIENFNCSIFELSAKLSIDGRLPVQIPLIGSITAEKIVITANVAANSPYQL